MCARTRQNLYTCFELPPVSRARLVTHNGQGMLFEAILVATNLGLRNGGVALVVLWFGPQGKVVSWQGWQMPMSPRVTSVVADEVEKHVLFAARLDPAGAHARCVPINMLLQCSAYREQQAEVRRCRIYGWRHALSLASHTRRAVWWRRRGALVGGSPCSIASRHLVAPLLCPAHVESECRHLCS